MTLSGRRGPRMCATVRSTRCGASTLQVEAGEIVGLIGVNGAGKSTTMLSIVGVVKPSQRNDYLRWTEH